MAKHLYLNSHTFAEPLPPAREEIGDWLIDHGEVCEGVYDGKTRGSWYAVTASGFRIYDTGWVIKS
jgi:hypothetical protein